MNVLMFLHDAYGGHGGISRNNRDVLDALVHDSRVERITALPRIAGDGSDPIPAKVDWRVGAAGGTRAFLAESLRAIFGTQPDLILAAHIRLLPVAYLAKLVDRRAALAFHLRHRCLGQAEEPAAHLAGAPSGSGDLHQRGDDAALPILGQMPEDRFRLLPCTVDLELFRPGARDPALVARYGLAGKRVLFTFGRLVSEQRAKGMDEVMQAMPGLLSESPGSGLSHRRQRTGPAAPRSEGQGAGPGRSKSSSPGAFPRRRSWPIIIWPTPMSCRAGARDLGS